MEYQLPDKNCLEKISKEEAKYHLSKMLYHKDNKDKLTFPVGIGLDSDKYFMNLEKLSGLLISGETGSGKSVFLNAIILSLLMKNSPSDLKFLMFDTRGIELIKYDGIPSLMMPVLSLKNEGIGALKTIIDEMKARQELFLKHQVRNITEYNDKVKNMEHIVIVIDEALELLNDAKEYIEMILIDGIRYGIHLLLATSSYFRNYFSKEEIDLFNYVLTFDLASSEQANFILLKGADLLTVYGEALVKCPNDTVINIHTPYVTDSDIDNVVSFIKENNK